MKALVKYQKGKGNMEIRDISEPNPGPHQVKIEVQAAGICGSDLHIYHDDQFFEKHIVLRARRLICVENSIE